jgi:hypothetical protein
VDRGASRYLDLYRNGLLSATDSGTKKKQINAAHDSPSAVPAQEMFETPRLAGEGIVPEAPGASKAADFNWFFRAG